MALKIRHSNTQIYSDEQLLDQYRKDHDSRHLGELYKRYVHLVINICQKYLQDRTASEDVAMTIFEKMLVTLSAKDILTFKQWLLTITKNECLTYLRKRRDKVANVENWQLVEEKSPEFISAWSPSKEKEISLSPERRKEDQQIQVRKALSQLKRDQRHCMELFFFDEMSYKEIEAQTSFSLKQVKSLLQNGKRQLKKILESSQGDKI